MPGSNCLSVLCVILKNLKCTEMRSLSILLIFIFCSITIFSQPSETIYQGIIAKEGYVNNASYGPFDIGFTFTFFGNSYTQFYVSSNGLVTFGAGSTVATEAVIPSATAPNNFIAAFWDDLAIDASGNIMYTTVGASPNKKCIIQFRNMNFYNPPSVLGTFTVILYETSNKIQIQYRLIVDNTSPLPGGSSAAIGIENSNGTAGVQYAYHDENAVYSGLAISFTPDGGGSYILNSNAEYDWVYLTKNISLPEPGIPRLISPSSDAIIGGSHTFEWAESEYTSSYTLYISDYPDLTDATVYYPGTNLTYNVTGLTLDKTYYWGVFATNTTGTTWCQVKRFYTSSAPPIAALPATMWVEQNQEKLTSLQYTGGDGTPVTATITSLPAQGSLYQVSGGLKAEKITTVPTQLTDPDRRFIYAADGGTGNGVGSFNFYVTDNTGNSPEATFTINVSPPGIPNVMVVAKNTGVEIQFDRQMNNPAGKENQFTVKVNGTPVSVTSVALKTGDPYSFSLSLATPLTGSETVTVAYTQGDVTATTGGYLLSFTDIPVTLLAQTINFPVIPEKKYGDPDFNPGASASSGGAITYSSSNLLVAAIISNKVRITGVGTSVITARQAGNGTYAPARYERLLTVVKGDQTITFAPLPQKTYGDADFNITATATSGLPVSFSSSNTSVATVTGNSVHIVGAGTTIITASQPGNENYNPASDVQQTLIVNRANQTIIFAPLPEKTYGDNDFTITATATSGLPVSFSSSNTSVATVTGNLVHIAGAGTTIITASQPGNENYNPASDVQQTLIVNKANQTITFAPLPEKTYGDADFNITATASSGLPVSFSSSNTSVATVTGNLVHIAGAGTTTITASQPGNENYNPAPDVEQILTVNKAGQTIIISRSPETMMITDTFRLQAITSSGLPVSFESSNTAVVSVSGNTLTALAKGTASIRAFNNGNSNYLPAETSFSVEVTTTHKEIMHLFTPNGDGINDYWELPQLTEWGRCEVKVYNRWGKLVYDNPDYNNLWDGTSNGNPLPEGAYYFIIKTQNAGTVKGTVNIIR